MYRFKRRPETASTEYEEQPEKTHPWSDVMDAGGYLIGGIRGRSAIIRNAAGRDQERDRRPHSAPSGWGQGRGSFDPHKVGTKWH